MLIAEAHARSVPNRTDTELTELCAEQSAQTKPSPTK
jgi:hypothetical protein